jgi:molecular chaperone HtpG
VEALKTISVPGIILLSEYSRRMQEMSKMYGMNGMDLSGMFSDEQTLVLNSNNSLIKAVAKMAGNDDKKENVDLICKHVYDLAMMSHKQLDPEAMTKFIERSNLLLGRLAEHQE